MEKADTRSNINFKHLKPLSRYANLITSDQKASQLYIPKMSFKIQRLIHCDGKRKLDDSCPDESLQTPAKKAFQPQALSPDLGCFVDSPPEKQDFASFDKITVTVRSEPCLEQGECGYKSLNHSSKSENVQNGASYLEIDEILSPSPCAAKAQRPPDSVEGFGNPAVLKQHERGDGRVKEIKEMPQNVTNVEEESGFVPSYVKDFKMPPSESGCQRRTSSFSVSDADAIFSGPLSEPVSSPVEPLEGDVDELWNIGLPILESSVCQSSTAVLNASGEQDRPASDEVQGGVTEPISKCQPSLCGEESSLDTSYETSLPLKVQVRSVVLAPVWRSLGSKPAPTCVTSFKSQRTVILDREAGLERDKQTYLHLVSRHINENPGADVMSELQNLMTHVAERRQDSGAPRWQHPSDLTRRNYQKRFGNLTPSMSLQEWHSEQCCTHKRFANIPKIFSRSQFI